MELQPDLKQKKNMDQCSVYTQFFKKAICTLFKEILREISDKFILKTTVKNYENVVTIGLQKIFESLWENQEVITAIYV